jgi:hypothetical protein
MISSKEEASLSISEPWTAGEKINKTGKDYFNYWKE